MLPRERSKNKDGNRPDSSGGGSGLAAHLAPVVNGSNWDAWTRRDCATFISCQYSLLTQNHSKSNVEV